MAKGHLILDEALQHYIPSTHCARPTQLQTSGASVDLLSFLSFLHMLHLLHLLHLLHSGFLICRGLKLFLLAVTVTLLSALGVWQSQLFTFHRPLVRCHFYPTIHSEKSVVLRGASTPFVSKSHCSLPGSRPEATWCWIDFEIAVSCFFKKTPWGTKFPLNLTISSFSPHRNYLTVKLRSINDHWGH